MNSVIRLIFLLAVTAVGLSAQSNALPRGPGAASGQVLLADNSIAAARTADDERLAATKAADPARLDAIFSNDLRYAHSSGKVDDKASYIKSLVSHSTVYESFDYQERNFKVAGPGVVIMSGRVIIHASNDGQAVVLDVNFLAVWHEENGHWRFLAWQSCRNLSPVPAPPPGK